MKVQLVSYIGPFAVSTSGVGDFVRFQDLNGECESQPSKGGATGKNYAPYLIFVYPVYFI